MENRPRLQVIALALITGIIAGAAIARRTGQQSAVPVVFASGIDGSEKFHRFKMVAPDPIPRKPTDAPADDSIELLSAKLLRERIVDVFPDGYLAIIAIIQGAAFGLLFIVAQQKLSNHPSKLHTAMILAQVLYEVVAIVMVTHLYLLLTTTLRWTPTILDTLIPYALGSGELFLALFTGQNSQWWLAMSAFSLASVFAFWNTRSRMTFGIFGKEKKAVYERHRKALKGQILYCMIMLVGSLSVAMLNIYGICPPWLNVALACGVAICGIAIGLFGERAQRRIYGEYEIPLRKSSI